MWPVSELQLNYEYTFFVDGSQTTISNLSIRLAKIQAKRISEGRSVSPTKGIKPTEIGAVNMGAASISVLTLLHCVTLVSQPFPPNPVDISMSWAVMRYAWAFGDSKPHHSLKLTPAAREINFHQKALLSDELGVGMAYYIMTHFFGANAFRDVSPGEMASRGLSLRSRFSPDYLFTKNDWQSAWVVECKGTQKTRCTTLNQMCRGIEQVSSVEKLFPSGIDYTTLVIATQLGINDTVVYIVDPEADGDKAKSPPPFPAVKPPSSLDRPSYPGYSSKSDFQSYARLANDARLLVYAGADEEAISLFRGYHSVKETDDWHRYSRHLKPETLQTDSGNYSGFTESVLSSDGMKIELFRGLSDAVRDRIMSGKPAAPGAPGTGPAGTLPAKEGEKSVYKPSEPGTPFQSRSLLGDGTAFQITASS